MQCTRLEKATLVTMRQPLLQRCSAGGDLFHRKCVVFRHAGELEGLGPNPSALDSIAYSIVVLAVSGITFGVIWARTKNLFALMLMHAAGDLLPNFGSFVRTWF